jgi:hypothetical protein
LIKEINEERNKWKKGDKKWACMKSWVK